MCMGRLVSTILCLAGTASRTSICSAKAQRPWEIGGCHLLHVLVVLVADDVQAQLTVSSSLPPYLADHQDWETFCIAWHHYGHGEGSGSFRNAQAEPTVMPSSE